MKGTEKQIKWATEIQHNIIKTFEAVIAEISPYAESNQNVKANIDGIRLRMDLLTDDNVYAGDIIDLFKDIRFSGDCKEDFGSVSAVYRVRVPMTATAKALLAR